MTSKCSNSETVPTHSGRGPKPENFNCNSKCCYLKYSIIIITFCIMDNNTDLSSITSEMLDAGSTRHELCRACARSCKLECNTAREHFSFAKLQDSPLDQSILNITENLV